MSEQVKLFVEGGGDHNKLLKSAVRRGFSQFLCKTVLKGKLPKIIACGSRNEAYKDYCLAIKQSELAVLLVDSESEVLREFETGEIRNWKPWEQLKSRMDSSGQPCDKWDAVGADEDCHLMVQEMETWFLADAAVVKKYFGRNFIGAAFPNETEDIEKISKENVNEIMKKSTSKTTSGTYDKGRHSFELLEQIDPAKIQKRSKWAKRFITLLNEKMNPSSDKNKQITAGGDSTWN